MVLHIPAITLQKMKELWQILMNLKDWAKGSPIRMLVVAILMRKYWLSRKEKETRM